MERIESGHRETIYFEIQSVLNLGLSKKEKAIYYGSTKPDLEDELFPEDERHSNYTKDLVKIMEDLRRHPERIPSYAWTKD